MIDFYEGWYLCCRLVKEGHITGEELSEDGKEMERLICKLAQEHYNWRPAEPIPSPRPTKEYEEELKLQTATTRLDHIYGIAIDWDGYRTIRGIGSLVDEIIACSIPSCRSDNAVLEEVKLTKMFKDIPDFLNTRVNENRLPFSWNFDGADVHTVMQWCEEHGYCFNICESNRASDGEVIGYPIIIKKKEENVNDIIQEEEA